MKHWHNFEISEVFKHLESNISDGLNSSEVSIRLKKYGPNELTEAGIKNPWMILWEQMTSVMVVILIIAAVVSIFLREYTDASVIVIIVIINAILGFTQEYRAEKAMAALKKLAVPSVRVKRDGNIKDVPALSLVPGDIVVFEAGNVISADCRIVESFNLRIQESALTGESEAVEKKADTVVEKTAPLGDRFNMSYMGTIITYGRGLGIVTETGMSTELGKIAGMIQNVEREPTPLQKRLDNLGKKLSIIAVGIIAIIIVMGLIRGDNFETIFLTAISMAVAAVPEGLPAVVTIALAIGAQRMLKKHALIRKLPAVETLGSVTVICSDKTGTLTENNMTAVVLHVANKKVELVSDNVSLLSGEGEKGSGSALRILLTGSALCNDSFIKPDENGKYKIIGDPTETALVVAAAKFGIIKNELDEVFPRKMEVPFDSERKRMTTIHDFKKDSPYKDILKNLKAENELIAFTKGAVDSLIGVSDMVWVDGRLEPLNPEWIERINNANNEMTRKGMRVLGLASRGVDVKELENIDEKSERHLIFIGMVGIIDPPRQESKDSVSLCKSAGIRPVMITGDHPLTACYIAKELGIYDDGPILTGQELSAMTDEELEKKVEDVSVFARVTPEHKLRIVTALQKNGEIAAMTGDGVNDAPALKKADIGVAMGITGTDVSKEAADMVLLDDNFSTIVAAVREGRVIYDNTRKFFKYLITSNSAEIWVMLICPFLGMPLPLLPLQILWINLLTDGLPAVALSVEPAERNIMRRPPYHPKESIFGRGLGAHVIWVGILMAMVSIVMGYLYWSDSRADWQTMIFTTLTLSQMAHVLAIRSGFDSLFTTGLFSNTPLILSVILTFILQIAVVYIPFLQGPFNTVSLPAVDFIISILLSSSIFFAVEIEKLIIRSRMDKKILQLT